MTGNGKERAMASNGVQNSQPQKRIASCQCGAVTLELTGKPIVTATCYCESCQRAGEAFGALPGSPGSLDADGGTPFILFRKDRVIWTAGSDRVEAHKLQPDAPTRRFVSRCCNSPICLEFTKGHWLSIYAGRVAEAERPPVEMRTMVKGRREDVILSDDIPNYSAPTGKFMWRLLSAWVAMGFRAPPVEAMKGFRP